MRILWSSLFLVIMMLAACANQKPVIYPNAHSQAVGRAQLDADIADCQRLAESAGANRSTNSASRAARHTARGAGVGAASGAVGGAIAGNAGRGAAIGAASGATAGLLNAIFRDSNASPAYKKFVSRCLSERGYELAGWN